MVHTKYMLESRFSQHFKYLFQDPCWHPYSSHPSLYPKLLQLNGFPSSSFLYNPAVSKCSLGPLFPLPTFFGFLCLHSLLFLSRSPSLSSHGQVRSAGHVWSTTLSLCSGLLQVPLAVLSLISAINTFPSTILYTTFLNISSK